MEFSFLSKQSSIGGDFHAVPCVVFDGRNRLVLRLPPVSLSKHSNVSNIGLVDSARLPHNRKQMEAMAGYGVYEADTAPVIGNQRICSGSRSPNRRSPFPVG